MNSCIFVFIWSIPELMPITIRLNMKKRHLLCGLIAAAVASGASADDKVVVPDSTGFKFTDVKVVKTTPVKDQNRTGTCWCFSGNSFFEDEIMRKGGDEQDLSE